MSGRGRESRASSEATVCLMSINAAPTFIFNLWRLIRATMQVQASPPSVMISHRQSIELAAMPAEVVPGTLSPAVTTASSEKAILGARAGDGHH